MSEREQLRDDLAKQMGDAGYCNYAACQEFLEKAFEAGRQAGLPKWISVEERLPEIGQKVMILMFWHSESDHNGLRFGMLRFDGHWEPEGGHGNFDKEVTHWMPLPESPKP